MLQTSSISRAHLGDRRFSGSFYPRGKVREHTWIVPLQPTYLLEGLLGRHDRSRCCSTFAQQDTTHPPGTALCTGDYQEGILLLSLQKMSHEVEVTS